MATGKGGADAVVTKTAAEVAAGAAAKKKSAADRRGRSKHSQPKKKGAGSASHRASQQGQQRADKPYQYGAPDEFPILNEDVKTRYWALPSAGGQFLLDRVESCTWVDQNAILTGSITVRENAITNGLDPELQLDQGDRVMCEASDGGRPFREVWTMRVYKPQVTMSSGQRTLELANDLDLLRQSEDNFLYPAHDKLHPHGWTLKQIVQDVCRRYQIPLGACATSEKPIARKKRVKRGSPLEVLRWVLLMEHRHHGRRLVLRWDRGKLWLLPLQRSPHLIGLGPTLIEGAFQSELPPEFGSAVSIRGNSLAVTAAQASDSAGRSLSKRGKMHVALESPESRKRFGYVHRIFYSPDARTDAQLREEGAAFLAAVAKPHRTLTLTHRGMPFVRRGDAIRLALGDEGLQRQVVYVNTVTHRDAPGNYESDIQVIFDDPYTPTRQSILFRLKATDQQAVGNRANRPWLFLPTGTNKADAIDATAPFQPPSDPTYGGSLVPNPVTDPTGPFGGGG